MLDDNNNSLLMVASYSGNYEIVKFLLEFGINKNLKNVKLSIILETK
jgi:ankyrin repeat protein